MWCPEARGGCGNDLGIKDLVKIIDKLEKELAHIRLMYMDRAAGWCGLAQNPADDNSK